MTIRDKIHIGTSGWHYDHWKGNFYPQEMGSENWLSFYCENFKTVEINNSFYQLPKEKTLDQWRKTTSRGFTFSVKGSRYITHMKKLKDPQDPVGNFTQRVRALEEKLGPVLFQLPPNWGANPRRLGQFVEVLPRQLRYAFEFRDPSWFDSRIYDILEDSGMAFCIYDFNERQSPKKVTSDFVYARLHGPDGPYQGQYSKEGLRGWTQDFMRWLDQGKEVFCYFDNDQNGYAPQDAGRLIEMMDEEISK